jgi:sortase A
MNQKKLLKIAAIICGISGAIILFSTIYPIASYEKMAREKYPTLISPLGGQTKGVTTDAFDYTKASNWFVGGAAHSDFSEGKVNFYTISIPKLKINNATVAIGGDDLTKNLVQYPGSADPGQIGNTVIFGHSVLPQFFNPKDYLTIFSTLQDLNEGDEIDISFDGVSYKYKIDSMFEVLPTDLYVLDQPKNDSYISLITCAPPGHPLKPKRLVVRARVVNTNENTGS